MSEKDKTNDYLVDQICSALSDFLDLCPKPDYKPRIYANSGVSNGEELQKMMDRQLRKIFRLNPRVEEKVGDGVTAYAPGLDVQPGKAEGDGKAREDGEEEWSESDHDEFDETSADEFHETEEDEFNTDKESDEAEKESEALSTTPTPSVGGFQLPPSVGWGVPPMYQSGALTPVSLLPPPPRPSTPPPLTKTDDEFHSSPGHSPSKMPRLERMRIPDPTDSEDWPSSDEPTTRRVATPPVAIPQRTALPRRMMRAGSPAPWSGSAPLPPPRSAPSPPPPSSLARRVLGELPLPKDEFASSSDEEMGPAPVVSIPHHPNMPRPPTPTVPPHNAMFPNDENAPRGDTVYGTPPAHSGDELICPSCRTGMGCHLHDDPGFISD